MQGNYMVLNVTAMSRYFSAIISRIYFLLELLKVRTSGESAEMADC